MIDIQRSTGSWTTVSIAAATILLLLAVWVRGIEGRPIARPDVDPDVPAAIDEAAQFLSPGAHLRLTELDEKIAERLASVWQSASSTVFTLEGCPPLLDWMHSKEGLEFESSLRSLRSEGAVEALASLTLIFQLARAAEWKPGFMGHTEHTEKLAGLLEAWLFEWGERGVEDGLLFESSVAAVLLYGKLMQTAYDAPFVGRNENALKRAKQNLAQIIGSQGSRTALGRVLQARHPRSVEILEAEVDCCRGLAEECEIAFPDLDGECEE